jgi:ABC-type sugar transport system substrate-binding protein
MSEKRGLRSQWLRTGIALVMAMLVFAGCGRQEQAAPGAPGASPKNARLRFAGIVFQEDQFFRLVLFGMREAARENNVELLEANSNNKPEKEYDLVNTYAAQKVDAILISPLSKKGSVAALKQAKDKGVIIIADNTPIEGDVASAYIECSATDLGQQTGRAAREYIQKKMGGRANMAIIAFKSLLPEQSDQRVNGFKSEVIKLSGVKIVAEQDAWLPEKAVKTVGDILTAHPEIDLIWSANEGGTIGSVLAVKNAGKAGRIVVFGTDASEQLIDFLLAPDNILQATTSQRPVEAGRLAVEYALKVKKGEPVQTPISMKGILLTREKPDEARAFEKQLKEWIAKGSQ